MPLVRELPTQVAATFYVVQDPALFNTCYSDALQVSEQFRFDAAQYSPCFLCLLNTVIGCYETVGCYLADDQGHVLSAVCLNRRSHGAAEIRRCNYPGLRVRHE